MKVAVVVPIKAFNAAKQRLSGVLTQNQRAALSQSMAAVVLRAAAPMPTFVVCDDPDVADWARANGAEAMMRADHGLNGAVRSAVDWLQLDGYDIAIVAHGDLPFASSFADLAHPGTVTLVPDRHDDGTNVLAVPTDAAFEFTYGPGSFRAHANQAVALGLELRVVRDESLAWDIDRPEDLSRVEGWIYPDNLA